MLISHKHKFITIDIPKTGTRSLRESLVPLKVIDLTGGPNANAEFYQHDRATRIKKQFLKNDWKWNEYFKFTIVRNPWDRYFSFFKYFKNYGEKYLRRDKLINWRPAQVNQGKVCVELFRDKTNQQVLKNIILDNYSQDQYYSNKDDEIIVDHIASFENLINEFHYLCNQVGIDPPTLKHGNKSYANLSKGDVYNQELIDLVAQKESRVIEFKNFNY